MLLQNANIDLLALTETHLHKETPGLVIEGHEIKRNNLRDRNGGDCAVYHNSSIEVVEKV